MHRSGFSATCALLAGMFALAMFPVQGRADTPQADCEKRIDAEKSALAAQYYEDTKQVSYENAQQLQDEFYANIAVLEATRPDCAHAQAIDATQSTAAQDAPAAKADDAFGAVAQADTESLWAVGISNGHDSQQSADKGALAECRRQAEGHACRIIKRFRNRCAALAESSDGGGGVAVSDTEQEAREAARNVCRRNTSEECRVTGSICG